MLWRGQTWLIPLLIVAGCVDRQQRSVDAAATSGGAETDAEHDTTSSPGSAADDSSPTSDDDRGSASMTDGSTGSAPGDGTGSAPGDSTGSGGGTAQVACGDSICDIGDYCCHGEACRAEDTPCRGLSIYCDSADDCPGEYCCADQQPPTVFECRRTCEGESQVIVCSHAEPNSCPEGLTCNITAQLPVEYGFCA